MNSASAASTLSSSSPLLKIPKIPSRNTFNAPSLIRFARRSTCWNLEGGRRRRKWTTLSKNGENQSITVESSTTTNIGDDNVVSSASEVVRNFYGGVNAHDVDSVEDLIAENCVYEDLIFPRPFVGRKEILEFFKKFTNSTSTDLQFVIDDLSTDDPSSVGVIWHLEWRGKPFPFSKGCSFYRLEVNNGKRQLTYGRDSVEPAIKPGDTALLLEGERANRSREIKIFNHLANCMLSLHVHGYGCCYFSLHGLNLILLEINNYQAAIRSVTWLLQQFPQLASKL